MSEKEFKNKLQEKLKEIANILCDSKGEFECPGVLAGVSGLALFMYYYARFTGDIKYAEVGEQALEKAVDMINNGYTNHTFCSGISGLAWTCEHLERNRFISRKSISFLNDLEPYLLTCMEKDFINKNYDFLHGGLGVGYYFLNKKEKDNKNIKTLFLWLKDKAIKNGDGSRKWESTLFDTGKTVFNISLSHGIASIVVVLTKILKRYPHIIEVKVLILKTIKYILQQRLPNPIVSYFPSYALESEDNPRQSRLAWCYGDLGIAQALMQAAKATGNKSHENEAINILLYNCNRKDLKNNGVIDACICHGAAGIAHIFNRLYVNAKIDAFKEASVYWMEKTLEMDRFSDGLAGFKTWQVNSGGWGNQYDLLEGIIGTGLSILSHLNPELINWDECLLLS